MNVLSRYIAKFVPKYRYWSKNKISCRFVKNATLYFGENVHEPLCVHTKKTAADAAVPKANIKLSQNCPEVSQNSDTSGHCVSIGIALQPTVQSAAADAQFFCRAGGVAVALLERRKDGGTVPAAGESGCRGGGRRSDGAVRPGA